jgi:hypothetical protein
VRRLILSAPAVFVLAAVVTFIAVRGGDPASGNPEPWPRFEMTYRVAANEQPDDNNVSYQVWRLTYTSSRHWEQTLISDDVYPGRVGSWDRFDAGKLTKFNALANTTTELPEEKDALAAPHRWLVPKALDDFERDYTTVSRTDGKHLLLRTEELPCSVQEAPALCPQDGLITLKTELTVTDAGIPLAASESSDAGTVEVFAVEALDFD